VAQQSGREQGEARERRQEKESVYLPRHTEWHSSQGESRERQGREDKKKNRYWYFSPGTPVVDLPGHAAWHSSQGESRERQGREGKKKNRY